MWTKFIIWRTGASSMQKRDPCFRTLDTEPRDIALSNVLMSNAVSREPLTNARRLLVLAFLGTAVAAIGFSGGWMFHSQGSSGSSSSGSEDTVASTGGVPAVVCIG